MRRFYNSEKIQLFVMHTIKCVSVSGAHYRGIVPR